MLLALLLALALSHVHAGIVNAGPRPVTASLTAVEVWGMLHAALPPDCSWSFVVSFSGTHGYEVSNALLVVSAMATGAVCLGVMHHRSSLRVQLKYTCT
jgi:hypothetical protein